MILRLLFAQRRLVNEFAKFAVILTPIALVY